MHLAVTIKHDQDHMEEMKRLIDAVRDSLSAESVTILEAPEHFNYFYPFPMVTICENSSRSRLYGPDALEKLRSLVAHR
jgi:hypothetical protein